ncbi:conserved hypothetical protein [Alkaliphilus metalliredigens QYMF]|uniref:Peptidase MA-like domain-containing protein n=1 Tax=Alkaliphilus metalliredigens (strain QYMF) TaxID=293826 RepID=A6TXA7_ALKMQ|nr:peptidase MA family metallohydrolase [Alkaliphilus metalliredigens]ABR50825.1 conserved hypothetical protein [Alkaliphilus metalliredigens QYMF]
MLKKNMKLKSWRNIGFVGFIVLLLMLGAYSSFKPQAVTAFRPLLRSAEETMVSYQTRSDQQIETENFIIKYQSIDEELLQFIAETAEDKYREATAVFQYEPKDKVLLVVYNDPNRMMKTVMLNKEKPPMGVYYGNALHILDPTLWVNEGQDLEQVFYEEGPILHELVHLLTDHVAKGNFPHWFTEGVSLYFEYEVDGYEWGRGVTLSEVYDLEALTYGFHQMNQYEAYTKSFRLVNAFVEEYGRQALINLIEELGEGKDPEKVLAIFNEF